ALRHANHVIVETSEDRKYLCSELGVEPARITVQHGGVNARFFEPDPATRSGILFLGTWIERKGIRDLVPAVTARLEKYPETRGTVAGCGCSADRVQGDFPEHVRAKVRVVVSVDTDANLSAVYREHAIFAFPTTFEGQPLVLLEAAASGLAIVTTKTC